LGFAVLLAGCNSSKSGSAPADMTPAPAVVADMAETGPAPDLMPPADLMMGAPVDMAMATPPDMMPAPRTGHALVTGGVTARSTHWQVIMTTGQAPGGNRTAASPSFKKKPGVVGATQAK
jgi:hypothetical protein